MQWFSFHKLKTDEAPTQLFSLSLLSHSSKDSAASIQSCVLRHILPYRWEGQVELHHPSGRMNQIVSVPVGVRGEAGTGKLARSISSHPPRPSGAPKQISEVELIRIMGCFSSKEKRLKGMAFLNSRYLSIPPVPTRPYYSKGMAIVGT